MNWSRDTPWRQGFLLSEDAITVLQLNQGSASENSLAIVATHDCDFAQDPKLEPNVEVIVGRAVAGSDGNYTHAKNSRKLHIEFAGSNPLWAEFEATGKRLVDKLLLNGFSPRSDSRLSPEDQATFQVWLASRYRRAAFPEEFERRLGAKEVRLHEQIAKAVRRHKDLISGIFFDVDQGHEYSRVGEDDVYILDIFILHVAEPDFDAAESAAKAAADEIKKAFTNKLFEPFNAWKQIELRDCEPVSESVLTYQQFRQLKRWRLEHLSLSAEPQQSALVE